MKQAILECPKSIKWKVWLLYSRIMIVKGDFQSARLCIKRASVDVPPKQVSVTLLENAKCFEICGEIDKAIEIMQKIKLRFKDEWKIQFEVVMMYIRLGLFDEAEAFVHESLKMHKSKGRLWAVYI